MKYYNICDISLPSDRVSAATILATPENRRDRLQAAEDPVSWDQALSFEGEGRGEGAPLDKGEGVVHNGIGKPSPNRLA